jgi:eukaryotic-like serine/threonine-protein kinase
MKLLMQHVQEEPVPPSSRTELPLSRAIDELVLACLHKDPTKRPRDAEDVLERAARCVGANHWDRAMAREWWEAHLPHFTRPGTVSLPPHHSPQLSHASVGVGQL